MDAKPSIEFADIPVVDAANATFYRTEGGFLGMRRGDYDGRVVLLRAFPLTMAQQFISVRDREFEELGIILDIGQFLESQRVLLEEELDRRYFVPRITGVKSVKEEFGYQYWDVETTAGPREFTMNDLSSNLIPLKEKQVLLLDIDGNRYLIPDLTRLEAKALKFIDIWL